ncbi:MAG: hypothetical protein ACLTGI_04595 [Hoylesella buccalis]
MYCLPLSIHAGQLVPANGIGFNTHTNWSVAITSTVLALLAIGLYYLYV